MFYYSVISGPITVGGYMRFILSRVPDSLQGPDRRVVACEHDLTDHANLKLRAMMEAIDVYLDDNKMPYEYAASGEIGDNKSIELVLTDPMSPPPR